MKRFYTLVLLAFAALAFSSTDAQAQELKFGYTNAEILLFNMPEYVGIRQQLAREAQAGQQELEMAASELQQRIETYQKRQPLLSEQNRQSEEQALMQAQLELQQAAGQKEQQLGEREAELMQPLIEKVENAIAAVAKQKGINVVIRMETLLYADDGALTDITLDVARRLGIQVNEDAASN